MLQRLIEALAAELRAALVQFTAGSDHLPVNKRTCSSVFGRFKAALCLAQQLQSLTICSGCLSQSAGADAGLRL